MNKCVLLLLGESNIYLITSNNREHKLFKFLLLKFKTML